MVVGTASASGHVKSRNWLRPLWLAKYMTSVAPRMHRSEKFCVVLKYWYCALSASASASSGNRKTTDRFHVSPANEFVVM